MSADEEFSTYNSVGEHFNTDDQVANLLAENQNLGELTARVGECRTTYLTQLQVLLMGYHEDFLVVGANMKEVCAVVDDLKLATREGRTALGDVSAWSLPPAAKSADESGAAARDVFALGDPWRDDPDVGDSSARAWSAAGAAALPGAAAAANAAPSAAAIKAPRRVVLPVVYLSRAARSNDRGNARLDSAAIAAQLIANACQTQRLLDCATDRVQRRVVANRQVLALKEIEEMAARASEHVGAAAVPLALLRAAVMDSFQASSWMQHALAIGDLEPRWALLAQAGRFASASALLLRCHSALIDDFCMSFVHSPIDVRMAALRLSSTLSAVVQHAGEMHRRVCDGFDDAAVAWWANDEVTRAATEVFALGVDRRRHAASNLEAGAGASAFQANSVHVVAESIAADVAVALNFLPCAAAAGAPVAHTLLRSVQPGQLKLLWDQVQAATAADFAFAAVDAGDEALVAQMLGAAQLPRQCLVRCLSPALSGVMQHRGLVAVFDSEGWADACRRLPGGEASAAAARAVDALSASYVSEAARRLWDHLVNVMTMKAKVTASMPGAMTAAAADFHENAADASELIDYYFASPDWLAQLDLASCHVIAAFAAALLAYRAAVGAAAQRLSCAALEQVLPGGAGHAAAAGESASLGAAPPVLRCFQPELFVSAVDVAVAAALGVAVPATRVAAMLLRGIVPAAGCATTLAVESRCAGAAEQDALQFARDAVFQRAPTTLPAAYSVNDLRLRADGGGALAPASVAERAALFVLAPYAHAARGTGELRWEDIAAAPAGGRAAALADALAPLTAHKVVQLLQHCAKVGGPGAAALLAVGVASFLCDESAFLSAECWRVVAARAPFLAKLAAPTADAASASSPVLAAVAAVLHVLEPAVARADVALPSAAHFDLLAAKVRALAGGVADGAPAGADKAAAAAASAARGRSVFAASRPESFDAAVARVDPRAPFPAALPPCCWRTLDELRAVVAELTTVATVAA